MDNVKHIYAIGICGKLIGPMCVNLKKRGFIVSGSDKGFYPPISTYLKDNGVDIKVGFKEEHITSDIDLVIVTPRTSFKNVEYKKVLELGIKTITIGELIEKFYIKENSVVIAGTYGKTTTTAFVTFMLKRAGYNPSYMIGGLPLNLDYSLELTDSNWSVFEGDEAFNTKFDKTPKFNFYHPKFLILTAAAHDHLNMYPTLDSYLRAFELMIEDMPEDGVIFANANGENINRLIKNSKLNIQEIVTSPNTNESGYASFIDYRYEDNYTYFQIAHDNEVYEFKSSILGLHNIKNIIMGVSLGLYLKIPLEKIKDSVEEFKGVGKRLEMVRTDKFSIIDDFAHAPIEMRVAINSVRERFEKGRLIAIYEPRTGSSNLKSSLKEYEGSYAGAYEVLIAPVYRELMVDEESRINANDIAKVIGSNSKGFNTYEDLREYIEMNLKENDILLFMSSSNFKGYVEYFKNYKF